ncbi:MAG: glycosyltransferase [Candidatus Limnocylindrales bacterium]
MAGFYFGTQARALARLGLSVDVVCPTPISPWPLPVFRGRWARYAKAPRLGFDVGVRILRPRFLNVPGQPRWSLPDRAIAHSAWTSRRSWRVAQLVHGHGAITGIAAWRLARRLRLPFVLTFHGSDINTWPRAHTNRLDDLRAATRSAAAVFAVSGALALRIEELTGVRAMHLPLGCDMTQLATEQVAREEARRSIGVTDDQVVALFVGNLLAEKGSRDLADAVLELDDRFGAIFVGDGPYAGHGANDPRAAGRLDYRGIQPHPEVIRLMSAADVLVLPSRSEGLPTVLVEAGAVGLPVIASPVGGIPELLGRDRGTLLAEPGRLAVTAALRRFVSERSSAERAAARLQQHVHDSYDADRNAARLLDCYRDIVGRSFGRTHGDDRSVAGREPDAKVEA